DWREIILHARFARGFGVVDQNIVVCRNRQFDALAGQREHPLFHGGIAVMAVRERVDVRVAGDQARRWDLPPETQVYRIRPAGRQRDTLSADAVFKTTRSVEFENSRG